MRAKYSFIVLSTLLFSFTATAGLFDSAPEFKCGREDAVAAMQAKIRDDAMSKLQETYLATPSQFYGKPLKSYQEKANQIAIHLENVTTKPFDKNDSNRSCSAKVTLAIPTEILGFIAAYPQKLERINQGGGKVLNNSVQWDNFVYILSLADNEKDISASYEYSDRDYVSQSLVDMTMLAMNKSEFEKADLNNKLNDAVLAYSENDSQLNNLWKSLPESVRASMKKEQNLWINEKAKKCGKISDASSTATPVETRINIYQCQADITHERYVYLGGEEERQY
ncbi:MULTISPECIES: lysozyme inhibitor LprI family protein [Enterobacter]|jgi:uncharacterized protein YecT (DUF1311 family)|uniref:DUF1311 domain-containing protein n=1 Tax=Enterobacter bugandensis TaxID=881260 RepID=A0ABX4VQV8_9ENTR|nr:MULTISPECIES: lysozyme inhibitor LprI family protein [Enterobacter]MBT1785369.1 DUF1311 domain-containing protein [Enterobacter bugandensis]MBZ6366709.1 DUF1311 domain-containing protein [Enterobacter bugandensis]MCK6737023.1 DUF1311 domain-containing protein [Enterobacter bugandensis]MCK6750709.1 DUF1311 domain-containing protein [Enterobacter bugandensis]MCK6763988.1 DUF1311 domain-containing protein [Enterobacter bugandensis]